MQALVRAGGAVYVDRDAPEPTPQPGEALVRPTLALITAEDLAVARGDIPHEGVMGSRFVGVVESIRERADDAGRSRDAEALSGSRVVCDIDIVDPASELARRGLGRHAPDRDVLGLTGRPGCFAERVAVPAANLSRVPETIADETAAFAEPLAAAIHVSRVVRLEGKGYVTILGDTIGSLLAAQVMARLNHTVRLLGRRADRLEMAEKWGIRHRDVREVGRRADQDVVVVGESDADLIEIALGLVRPRGTIVLRDEPMPLPGLPIPPRRGPDLRALVLGEIELVGARTARVADAVGDLESGGLDLSPLIARRFELDGSVAALRFASEDPARAVVIGV